MRLILIAAATLLLGACQSGPVGNPSVPAPAKPVDLKRYAGLWYEYARYENRFEKGCEGVTAEYRPRPDGKITVINTCREGAPDGPAKSTEGSAKPTGDALGAKLKVAFFGPFYFGDYQVLDRDDDYMWAIVGDASGRYLWVLTRSPTPAMGEKTLVLRRLKEMGYDTDLLRLTKQPPGATP